MIVISGSRLATSSTKSPVSPSLELVDDRASVLADAVLDQSHLTRREPRRDQAAKLLVPRVVHRQEGLRGLEQLLRHVLEHHATPGAERLPGRARRCGRPRSARPPSSRCGRFPPAASASPRRAAARTPGSRPAAPRTRPRAPRASAPRSSGRRGRPAVRRRAPRTSGPTVLPTSGRAPRSGADHRRLSVRRSTRSSRRPCVGAKPIRSFTRSRRARRRGGERGPWP